MECPFTTGKAGHLGGANSCVAVLYFDYMVNTNSGKI